MRRRPREQTAKVWIACAIWPALALLAPTASAQQPSREEQLRSTLAAQMAQGPATAGAYVVDLTDGHVVFDDRGNHKRLSASVTKLYTTATALIELGPRVRVSTRVLATGRRDDTTWSGNLYLRGGGDFTFGTAAFARKAYGSGASVERLAAGLRRSGLRRRAESPFRGCARPARLARQRLVRGRGIGSGAGVVHRHHMAVGRRSRRPCHR